ncbi:MAG: hypothetical protein IKZ53_01700, partial [Selenomonadaceae bacterium]|nr:hypothetical protein [Selenomonadaceae bacterium]
MDYVITNGGGKLKALEGDNNISITSAAGGNNTVVTGDGDDTVNVEDRDETEEKRYYNNIDVGDGNNYINNSDVELSTISAGSSNDTIITGGGDGYYNPTSINAGAGDNKITVNSGMTYGKIYAEGGNDLVSISGGGSENLISVAGGDDSVIA